MIVDDYRKADCTLFRTPPIDLSTVNMTLERALVDAWKNGVSADEAVRAVVEKSSVVRKLTSQVAESLDFQREMALKQAQEEAAKKAKAQQEEAGRQKREVDAQYKPKLQSADGKAAQAQTALTQEKTQYDAQAAKLEEMRARVKTRLADVGGARGFEQLMAINEAITEPGKPLPVYALPKSPKGQKSPTPSTPAAADAKALIDIVKDAAEPAATDQTEQYGVFRSIWSVLNYKIW